MAELRSFRIALLIAALLALGVTLSIAGCRSAPQPVTRSKAPEAPKEQPAPAATADAPPQAPAPVEIAAAREKTGDAAPVVVDAGVEDAALAPATLFEAAHAERQRRAGAGKKSSVVINDKTLPRYASKGQITIADTKKDKNKTKTASPLVAAAEAEARDEQHWRSRARQLRESWRHVADEVKELERKSAELRQKFYGETDTFLRDTQVKPDWDRVLDRLRQARLDVDTARRDLAKFLEEGRAAGAQPGWLDEGSEEEPADESGKRKEPVPALQSIEPPVIENDSIKSPPPSLRGR
ncbi:MAG: hypothetical protein ABIS20_01410 [Thermoanaerobaculia bacterium]